MVWRSGFYTNGISLCRKDIQIEWDLGFDKEAKVEYIRRVRKELGGELEPCVDVTTASPIQLARNLSPHFVVCRDGTPLGDLWKTHGVPGVYDYLYYTALTEDQLNYIMSVTCFVDVFYNPTKGGWTQARSLAILKMLLLQNETRLLKDPDEFLAWYNEYCVEFVLR